MATGAHGDIQVTLACVADRLNLDDVRRSLATRDHRGPAIE